MNPAGLAVHDETGFILYGASGDLFALDPEDGERRWELEEHSRSAIAEDGTIYTVRAEDDEVYVSAVDPEAGSIEWSEQVLEDATPSTSPVLGHSGRLYLGAAVASADVTDDSGRAYAVDLEGPEKSWGSYSYQHPFNRRPAVGDEMIFIAHGTGTPGGSRDAGLYAFDSGDSPAWREDGATYLAGGPLVGPDGAVYYATTEYFRALTSGGDEIWKEPTDDRPTGGVVGADGLLYTGAGGEVFALEGDTGDEVWRLEIGSSEWDRPRITDPVMTDGGLLIVGAYDRRGHDEAHVYTIGTGAEAGPAPDAPWPMSGGDGARSNRQQ